MPDNNSDIFNHPLHVIGCCGHPATCQSTVSCMFRENFREQAKNTDYYPSVLSSQQAINEATHGFVQVDPNAKAFMETDPNGIRVHAPGAKLDAGKVRPSLVLGGFANALMEVSKVGTAGAKKYTDNGWMEVPDGVARYTEALTRHQFKEWMGEKIDPDFGLLHAAHLAWNALARLELMIREDAKSDQAAR